MERNCHKKEWDFHDMEVQQKIGERSIKNKRMSNESQMKIRWMFDESQPIVDCDVS